jgi:hypothetical protein
MKLSNKDHSNIRAQLISVGAKTRGLTHGALLSTYYDEMGVPFVVSSEESGEVDAPEPAPAPEEATNPAMRASELATYMAAYVSQQVPDAQGLDVAAVEKVVRRVVLEMFAELAGVTDEG